MMNKIKVKKEIFKRKHPDLEEVSERLDKHGPGESIEILNWEKFKYKPEVRFNIAYSTSEIFLKYYIKEQYIKAEKSETNQMVCEDSCVEFFVSPADDGIYYNIEFNPIGTCLLGSGTSRNDSKRAPEEVINLIRRKGSLGAMPFKEIKGEIFWTITIAIPFGVFFRHDIKNLSGNIFRANFYKCGDMLTQPHYVTWNPIGTDNPDFHQPEFFGLLTFE